MLQLFIKTLTGQTITIEVPPDSSIQKIKEEIAKKENIFPYQQRLLLNGKELIDHKNISDYNISNNTTIHLIIKLTGIQIFIKDDNDRSISLVVEQDDTIKKVKQLYYEKTNEQVTVLLLGGVHLNDDMKIRDYNIQKDATLQTSKRLKGGKRNKK